MRTIPADEPPLIDAARELVREYAASLGVDLSFQDFAGEMAAFDRIYALPHGRVLLGLGEDGDAVGCVAARRLDETTCEMKRLYVRPKARGSGLGRALAEAIVVEARALGYERMVLDTLPQMAQASALYGSLGFVDIAPYRYNPIAGTRFMELCLKARYPA